MLLYNLKCLHTDVAFMTYLSTNKAAKSKGVSIVLSCKGHNRGIKVTLGTLYAPKNHQDLFISRSLDKLLEFAEGHLILGSDFNVPLIPSVDTYSGSCSVPPGSSKRISQAFHRAQLTDVWCLLYLLLLSP